ncbi:Potassium efflux system KefA protein / Small-conductance mechanosensitive channel [Collimonas arenae]|uniref:Potassium efflux system KefA protein / Small-conductance mechanosensitive channel n=1 Tax=Collimonas arenae TaxID=279058 RepID=A0A0A1FDW8_9BURK|nr:mechanosensitive ion channel domain-containing protein [Collimonas arenae]AIY42696.1 Potassium efflux system KefA protein / Small-conductance mechanosensitive channel [Collimonas arenae]
MPDIFTDLLNDLLTNLRAPGLLLQVGLLLLCICLGWVLARLLRRTFTLSAAQPQAMQIGLGSFVKVLTPILTFLLLLLVKLALQRWHQPVNILRLMVPLVASLALMRFVFYVLRRVFARNSGVGTFLLLFEKSFGALVWIGLLLYITGWWPDLFDYLDSTVLPIGRYKVSLLSIMQALVSVLVTLVIALWAGATIEERLMRVNTMHSSIRTVVARMARAVLILIAVLLSLSLVGIDLTVLSVFGGALGVALGLGLQKIASSYVSGFVILLERSLAIGDMVGVSTFYGKVVQINSRYTVLQGLDGIDTVIPNEIFMINSVQNYSLTNRILRLSTQVTIVYQDDVESVLTMLEQAALGVDRVSREVLPQALLLKIGADGLELELGFWITDPENGRLNVLSDVNRAIWRALQARQIKIAHVKREIKVYDADLHKSNFHSDSQQDLQLDGSVDSPKSKNS